MIDAVIVGGSLAGTATAINLVERGRRVVILERSTEVRRKACGEGLFPRGVAELERLGVSPFDLGVGSPLDGVRFHAGRYSATARFAGSALGVQRCDLDPLLRARAVEAGVDLRTGTIVRSLATDGSAFAGVTIADGEVVRARTVVGADGLGSRLRRQAGLDRPSRHARYGVSAHVRLPEEPEPFVDITFRGGTELYVTPVGGRIANVAALLSRAGMRRFAGEPARAFRAVLASEPSIAHSVLLDEPLAAGPFPAQCRQPYRENLVLVGDAAGFFDAITGEGMSTSLVSARMCAEAVDVYLDGDTHAFRRYAWRRRALVRNSDLLARVSLALSSRPAFVRHSVRNLMRQPETFARLVGVSSGELGLRDLRPRDLPGLLLGV